MEEGKDGGEKLTLGFLARDVSLAHSELMLFVSVLGDGSNNRGLSDMNDTVTNGEVWI